MPEEVEDDVVTAIKEDAKTVRGSVKLPEILESIDFRQPNSPLPQPNMISPFLVDTARKKCLCVCF